jgi:hypothetical protein
VIAPRGLPPSESLRHSRDPGEPAQNMRLTLQIGRPEPPVGALGRHVKQNCVGLPEHETVVLKRRHFLVGIESEVLRSQLVAPSEVNGLLAVEGEVALQGHDAEHAWRWRKELEFHFHDLSKGFRTEPTDRSRRSLLSTMG